MGLAAGRRQSRATVAGRPGRATRHAAGGLSATCQLHPGLQGWTIDVQKFESVQGQAATLEAVWTVRKTAGGEIRSGRTVAREAGCRVRASMRSRQHIARALAKMSAGDSSCNPRRSRAEK